MKGENTVMKKNKISYAEYIWLDGASPTQELRSKTRVLFSKDHWTLENFPEWSFDGSSTWQALGRDSDCILKPVFFTVDPMREGDNFLVLCEVHSADGKYHPTNERAKLRELIEKTKDQQPLIGFEQEYTFLQGTATEKWPLGWPDGGFPGPQGPFYCGVGADKVHGRDIVETHTRLCEKAQLSLYGVNAEVMPAQWEFQIGYRGGDEPADPLAMSDHLWVARYLLKRVAENYDVYVSFSNKPIKGDWNGAGMHTNFSTKDTRDKNHGVDKIHEAIEKLKEKHKEHIVDYGHGLSERLTGLHETCHISEFRAGVSNRGASIRIPISTHQKGCGYFEDRRPGANANPYIISSRLLETVCL